jgi:hypothetical protein
MPLPLDHRDILVYSGREWHHRRHDDASLSSQQDTRTHDTNAAAQ